MTRRRGKSTNGTLPPEDEDVWSLVAATVEPLKRKRRVAAGAVLPPERPPAPRTAKVSLPTPLPPRTVAAPPAPDPTFDRKQARRIEKGHAAITAKVDLHGLRESEAHARLVSFIRRCVADDHRLVLVITGEGGRPSEQTAEDHAGIGRGTGVLRRNVPRWLAEPGLAAMIVSYSEARPRHGGSGALYVRLRRRRD